MPDESFILVNLKEEKAKKIAQAISNETARKILDFLSKREATETEIAKALNLPISTVHYNIKQLLEVKLVQADEFHYSEKGKEVNHYKVSNKFVVIAPESPKIETIKQKLSRILPVALITIICAGFLQIFSKGTSMARFAANRKFETLQAEAAINETIKGAAPISAEAARTVTAGLSQNIALWFLIGGFFAIIVYLLIERIRR